MSAFDVSRESESFADRAVTVRRGTITLISGCMFSGKTTELLRRVEASPAQCTIAFKHVIDRRYRADAIVTHDGRSRAGVAVASPEEISRYVREGLICAAIDEAHFFDLTLVEIVRELGDRGLSVLITTLDRDSWGKPFRVAERLRTLADETIEKRARCARCGDIADRTQRLTPIVDGNMVGGPESYESRCLTCWRPPAEPPPD